MNEDRELLEYIEANRKPIKIERKRFAFYPSGISYCNRKNFYNLLEIEKTNPSDYTNIMDLGNSAHEYVTDNYKKAGLWVGDEVAGKMVYEGIPLSYRVDLFIDWDEQTIPVEIKSISTWKYKKYDFEEYPEHLAQLQIYLNLLGFEFGYIHLINRDNGQQKIIPVQKDEQLFNTLIDRVRTLVQSIKEKESPKKEVSYLCKYCEWRDLCGDEKAERATLKASKGLPYIIRCVEENVSLPPSNGFDKMVGE